MRFRLVHIPIIFNRTIPSEPVLGSYIPSLKFNDTRNSMYLGFF